MTQSIDFDDLEAVTTPFEQSTYSFTPEELGRQIEKDNAVKGYADTSKSIFEDDNTDIEDVMPSELENNNSGVIKSINAVVPDNYPNITIHTDPDKPMLKRTVMSIKSIIDTETNDSKKIKHEKRITVHLEVKNQQGVVKDLIIGTIKPKGLRQLLNVTNKYDLTGYYDEKTTLDKRLLYALTVI